MTGEIRGGVSRDADKYYRERESRSFVRFGTFLCGPTGLAFSGSVVCETGEVEFRHRPEDFWVCGFRVSTPGLLARLRVFLDTPSPMNSWLSRSPDDDGLCLVLENLRLGGLPDTSGRVFVVVDGLFWRWRF